MKLYYIYIIGIIFCLTSCGHHSQEWEKLQDVETYIEEHADSALSILQAMNPTHLTNKEEKAKYALLLSMAMDKNFIDRTDFDVLQPAIDYYRNHGTATDKLRTYYYEGRIYTNQGNNAPAIICFNKGLNEGGKSKDLRTKARTHFAQANIYLELYKIDKYIEENILAAKLFKETNLQNSYANCLTRIINGYIIQEDKENAQKHINLYKSILDSVSKKRQEEFYTAYLNYAINHETKEEIASILNEYCDNVIEERQDPLSITSAYLTLNCVPKAYSYIQQHQLGTNIKQDIRYYALFSKIHKSMNHLDLALEAFSNYSEMTDSIDLATFEEDTHFIEMLHKLEMETIRKRAFQNQVASGGLIALLVLSIICIWVYVRFSNSKKAKEQLEIEKEKYRLQCLQIEEERDNLTQLLSKQKEELSDTTQSALMERLTLLNRFFTAHITNSNDSTNKLHKEIETLIANRDTFVDSTRLSFAASHPRFIKYLEEHGLTEWEINYCCLYAVGLRGKEVGTYIKMRSHYNQSSIIREKLGIGEHDTNLGIYIRKLLKGLPTE